MTQIETEPLPVTQNVLCAIIVISIIWGVITFFQWITTPNYDGCDRVYWCYENSRYTLVETIQRQIHWFSMFRVI